MLPLNDQLASELYGVKKQRKLKSCHIYYSLLILYVLMHSNLAHGEFCCQFCNGGHVCSTKTVQKSVLSRFCCQLTEMNFLMQFKLSAVAKNHFCHCGKELSCVVEFINELLLSAWKEQRNLKSNCILHVTGFLKQLLGESNLSGCSMKLTEALN